MRKVSNRIGSVDIILHTEKGPYNIKESERMLEVPLAQWFFKKHDGNIIEVGAVLPVWQTVTHRVIDPYDGWAGCERKYADEIDYEGTNLLSISTVEHIGFGEYNQEKDIEKPKKVIDMMRKASSYLITWPCGYNVELDKIYHDAFDCVKVKRCGPQNWKQDDNIRDVKYGHPWPWGNGIYILTNCEELRWRA